MTEDNGVNDPRSAVALLRRATHADHVRLETQIDVMSAQITVERYRDLLSGFASLHQTLDREIGGQFALTSCPKIATLDFHARRKAPGLAFDLSQLGRAMPGPVAFQLTSLAGALGALYVCEGATLGGRIITPHLTRVLGASTPVTYFGSYGLDVPRMWLRCRTIINDVLVSQSSKDVAATVAVAVFERLADVLS